MTHRVISVSKFYDFCDLTLENSNAAKVAQSLDSSSDVQASASSPSFQHGVIDPAELTRRKLKLERIENAPEVKREEMNAFKVRSSECC